MGGKLPANFEYHFATVLLKNNKPQEAMQYAEKYIKAAGKNARYYNEAFDLLLEAKKTALTLVNVNGVSVQMVDVPAGSFIMGSPDSEASEIKKPPAYWLKETPMRQVNVPAFQLGKTEVTRGMFAAFVTDTGHKPGGCWEWNTEQGKTVESTTYNWRNPGFEQNDDHPVVCVSWNDAQSFVAWLNSKTGQKFRLPSEAEWEYAARAGCSKPYNLGGQCRDEIKQAEASFLSLGSKRGTATVASFAANGFGLYDMHGNVYEWVQDCAVVNYEGARKDGGAVETGACDGRVMRGGAWISLDSLRSAARSGGAVNQGFKYYGFRLARTN